MRVGMAAGHGGGPCGVGRMPTSTRANERADVLRGTHAGAEVGMDERTRQRACGALR